MQQFIGRRNAAQVTTVYKGRLVYSMCNVLVNSQSRSLTWNESEIRLHHHFVTNL